MDVETEARQFAHTTNLEYGPRLLSTTMIGWFVNTVVDCCPWYWPENKIKFVDSKFNDTCAW